MFYKRVMRFLCSLFYQFNLENTLSQYARQIKAVSCGVRQAALRAEKVSRPKKSHARSSRANIFASIIEIDA